MIDEWNLSSFNLTVPFVHTLIGHFIRATSCVNNCLLTQLAKQPIAWLQFNVVRWSRQLNEVQTSVRMRKNGDLSVFQGGLVSARQARIFMHHHLLYGELSEKEEISSEATVWTKMPC